MLRQTSKKRNFVTLVILTIALCSLSGCLTAKRLNKFVAAEYNNELPKPNKKNRAEVQVISSPVVSDSSISTTLHKTDKFLPLLFYWKYDHRQICSLNPSIPATNFSNSVNAALPKKLIEKLNGRKLALALEQAPAAFSIVAKENMVWFGYAVSWSKIYIEPDLKDLVVSYKLLDADKIVKTGTVTVKNKDPNKGFRFFQSWKSATSEYLSEYNANLTAMAKMLITQLTEEI